MQGINYVTNEEGNRVAVQIDLKKYGELWEDFFDVLTAKKRQNEPRESLGSVKVRLKKRQTECLIGRHLPSVPC